VLGGLFLILRLYNPGAPGLARFGVAHLFIALAVMLIGARNAVPDFVSIQIGNALLLGAAGLMASTARAFAGRPASLPMIVGGAALWLAACQVPAFYTSLDARVALSSALIAAYNFSAAAELWREGPTPLASRWIAVVLLFVQGVIYAVRVPLALVWPMPAGGAALPAGPWYEFLTLEALLRLIAMAFAVLSMAKELAEAQSRETLVAARDAAAQASEAKSRFLARMSH